MERRRTLPFLHHKVQCTTRSLCQLRVISPPPLCLTLPSSVTDFNSLGTSSMVVMHCKAERDVVMQETGLDQSINFKSDLKFQVMHLFTHYYFYNLKNEK